MEVVTETAVPAIPLALPDLGAAEEAAVLEVLRSGKLAMGERSAALESAWAAYCGVEQAVFMANATLALEAVLLALGVGPGDEVVTVSFSFNATASAVLRVGARPVFVDVREDDFCMDPDAVEAAITSRTRVIMPVHLYGLMADMARIKEVADRHGLRIVEEAAQAIGARYEGRGPGAFGPAVFSLYATKNVTAIEGGMVGTNDAGLAEQLRVWRNHGSRMRYQHAALGTNAKPTDLAAAIALVQLAKLDQASARRSANAAHLTAGLAGACTPIVPAGRVHAWHQYTVRFPGQRDRIAARLAAVGIGSEAYYRTPIHHQPYIRDDVPLAQRRRLSVTERLADEVLSLPVRPNLRPDEVDRIVSATNAALHE
jgi:dTDP-4-amino-4,6-dideoxygalactose transaminase